MGLGKKIIDFIAPPIKQKVPVQETKLNHSEQQTQKKKQKIGVQEVQEIEYEMLESHITASAENSSEIPELETEEYVIEQQIQEKYKESDQNTSDSLAYQEYEQITKDIELSNLEKTRDELDIAVENITSQYTVASIPLEEEVSDFTPDIHTFHLSDTTPLYASTESVIPFYASSTLFENAVLTYIENTLITENENVDIQKFAFAPLSEIGENTKEIIQQIDIEDFNHVQNLPTEKFIFSHNKKSITLPIDTSMQTELSNPIDYQPTDIQKITESISLEAPAMNALLKNAVRTIMQRKGIQEITPETLPLIKDDLSLILEASGSNLSTMVGDVLQIKKIVNDKVNERRDKINEYKNELTQKISQLLSQVRHLEGEVGKLDNIIYTDIEELTKINKTLDTYQMLLTSISEQKFNFE